jgi:hypothetical protein
MVFLLSAISLAVLIGGSLLLLWGNGVLIQGEIHSEVEVLWMHATQPIFVKWWVKRAPPMTT